MSREEAVKIVMKMLEKNVDGLKMSEEKMDKTLVDLGVDSLDVMLLMMDIAEAAAVDISDDDADELRTPEEIVNFITT